MWWGNREGEPGERQRCEGGQEGRVRWGLQEPFRVSLKCASRHMSFRLGGLSLEEPGGGSDVGHLEDKQLLLSGGAQLPPRTGIRLRIPSEAGPASGPLM